MSIVTVVARLVVKEKAVEIVRTELLKLIEPTRQENGCIEYTLHQDNTDSSVFIFYEKWENMACLECHLTTPHFRYYVDAVEGMIEEKIVHKMTRIG